MGCGRSDLHRQPGPRGTRGLPGGDPVATRGPQGSGARQPRLGGAFRRLSARAGGCGSLGEDRGRGRGDPSSEAGPRARRRHRLRKRLAEPFHRALSPPDRQPRAADRDPRRSAGARPHGDAGKARCRHREAPRIRPHVVRACGNGARAVDRAEPAKSAMRLAPRAKLALLAAIFLAPIVASVVAYRFFRPEPTANYGELLLPPAAITSHSFGRIDGGAFAFSELRGLWILVASDSGVCEPPCAEKLTAMRQVRLALGRNATRLARVFVVDDLRAPERAASAVFEGTVVALTPTGMSLPP